jgi:hypothetical protein
MKVRVHGHQGKHKCKNKYKSKFLESWENFKAFEGDFKNQIALKQPTSNEAVVAMEHKANRKYKTKKEK